MSLPTGESAELPDAAASALIEALEAMAAGHEVVVLGADRDLTTSQAADVLGVSRQYLVRLLDDDVIPSYLVGSHRRVRLDDVAAFRMERDTNANHGSETARAMTTVVAAHSYWPARRFAAAPKRKGVASPVATMMQVSRTPLGAAIRAGRSPVAATVTWRYHLDQEHHRVHASRYENGAIPAAA